METRKVLEKSTNTHFTDSDVEIVNEHPKMTTIELKTNGSMIVEHGHHFTVATEIDTVRTVKITQQEYNPILKKMQNAFD